MKITASDFYTFFRPSKCDVRIYFRNLGIEESAPSPYDEVLRRLGERHEKNHLATFPNYVDLSVVSKDQREQRTREEIEKGSPVLYQPFFRAQKVMDGVECEIVGEPDFLIREQGNYIIRDSKISRRINDKDHPEILRQLELYGWLYEQTLGPPPSSLQVHSGTGEIVEVPYDGGISALQLLKDILTLKLTTSEPYSPVGWTKCGKCGFSYRCWDNAEKKCDVALVAGVDQGLAIALREERIQTVHEFLSAFNEARLADFQRPWGSRTQKVGKRAAAIIRMAQALALKKEIFLQPPAIPDYPNYVMFDLEGLPPHLDELDKVYLWGVQVFGDKPSDFLAAVAGFGESGDREGWFDFLTRAKEIFLEYGDIPFIHWANYELIKLNMYIERFGDPEGIAARVRANLRDLLLITQNSIALPLPSYSLKVVEKYVGFKRKLEEYNGEVAMAKYIEATETEDESLRSQVLNEILAYNKEDLEATWAVFQWLRAKACSGG
jgi:predicted RecB family nuclease